MMQRIQNNAPTAINSFTAMLLAMLLLCACSKEDVEPYGNEPSVLQATFLLDQDSNVMRPGVGLVSGRTAYYYENKAPVFLFELRDSSKGRKKILRINLSGYSMLKKDSASGPVLQLQAGKVQFDETLPGENDPGVNISWIEDGELFSTYYMGQSGYEFNIQSVREVYRNGIRYQEAILGFNCDLLNFNTKETLHLRNAYVVAVFALE